MSIQVSKIKSMPVKDELENIWNSIVNKHQLASSTLDIEAVAELSQLFMNCYRNNTTLPITKADLLAEVKVALLEFVKNRLCETSSAGKIFDWNVCVVVGNNYVKKSLEVITELNFDGEQLEFDTDMFGKLRHQLASAIVAMESYSSGL